MSWHEDFHFMEAMKARMVAQCQEIEETSKKIENHMKLIFKILNIRPQQLAQDVTPQSDGKVFSACEITAKQHINCHEDSVLASEPKEVKKEEAMESILGENMALSCHGMKDDAIKQNCDAKTIEQQTDATKRGVLKWLFVGRKKFAAKKTKHFRKILEQDEDDYSSTTKIFFDFLRLKHYWEGNQINVMETILLADIHSNVKTPKAKVPKAEPTNPKPTGSVAMLSQIYQSHEIILRNMEKAEE
ncbi:hypothetical protein GQ457_04G023240 [Hibiscus cannabinus]